MKNAVCVVQSTDGECEEMFNVVCFKFFDQVMEHVHVISRIFDYDDVGCELTNTSVAIQNLRRELMRNNQVYVTGQSLCDLRNWVFDFYDNTRLRTIESCISNLRIILAGWNKVEKERMLKDIEQKLSNLEECYQSIGDYFNVQVC